MEPKQFRIEAPADVALASHLRRHNIRSKLLVGQGAYRGGQGAIVDPKIRFRPVDHGRLEQFRLARFVMSSGAGEAGIHLARMQISLKLRVDKLWGVVFLEP